VYGNDNNNNTNAIGGVGKSSITLRFVTDTFNSEYLPTVGTYSTIFYCTCSYVVHVMLCYTCVHIHTYTL
jgi:hypothetical protein